LLASIVATCKLNDINPVAYIAETLEAIIAGHPQSKNAPSGGAHPKKKPHSSAQRSLKARSA
jgi:hypothetical protein